MYDRLWRDSLGHGCLSQTHDNCVTAGCGFCLYPLLHTSLKNQQTSLSTCVLNRSTHERVDQLLQDHLARHGLRHFDNRREIKVFDPCADRASRSRYWLFLPEVRIQLVELPHLAIGSPTEIAVLGVPQIRMRDLLKTTRRVEARGQLVGEGLIVDKAVCARRADGLFVEALGIEFAALNACNLRTDQRSAVLEILRAILRPNCELSVMDG